MIHALLRSLLSPMRGLPYPAYGQGAAERSRALSGGQKAGMRFADRVRDAGAQNGCAMGSESVSNGLGVCPGRGVRVRVQVAHRASERVEESQSGGHVKGKDVLRYISQSLAPADDLCVIIAVFLKTDISDIYLMSDLS
jgi:hypothetical protein